MAQQNLANADRAEAWEDIERLEGWAGEVRLNLLRLVAIALFYGRHLIEVVSSPANSDLRGAFNTQITWLTLMWAGFAGLLHVWLARRRIAPGLKYAVVGYDATMITILCAVSGGPRTPLVLLYFPLIASAPLRMSLRLVYVATASAIAGYLCVLAHHAWYVIGFTKYYSTPQLRIPRREEAIIVLAMLVTGLLTGQVVRQARRLTQGHPVAVAGTVST